MNKQNQIKEKYGFFDRLKINLMCKWLEDYGFDDIISDYPEMQKRFAEKLFTFIPKE